MQKNDFVFQDHFTEEERRFIINLQHLKWDYWLPFLNQTFDGYNIFHFDSHETLSWMLLLLNGKNDMRSTITAVLLFEYCRDAALLYHTTCLETLLRGGIPDDYYAGRDELIAKTNILNVTSSFYGIFSTLWHAKLPCHDTLESRPSN